MNTYSVSYDGSIPVTVRAESAADAREGFALDVEAEGHTINREYIDVEKAE